MRSIKLEWRKRYWSANANGLVLTHGSAIATVTTVRHASGTTIIGLRRGAHDGSSHSRSRRTSEGAAGKCSEVGNLVEMHFAR